jgi:hypothetical protein
MDRHFSAVERCPASPTGWVEIADDGPDDFGFLTGLTRSELMARPDVRVLSAELAAEADRVDQED